MIQTAVVVRAELVVARSAVPALTVLSRVALSLARLPLCLHAHRSPVEDPARVAVHLLPWSSDYTYICTAGVNARFTDRGHTRWIVIRAYRIIYVMSIIGTSE